MTEEEKQQLIGVIQQIPTNTDQTTYHIGQFILYDGTTLNSLTEKERKEHNRKFWEEFKKMAEESNFRSITTDLVIEKCKKDRRFYEDLLMRLDDGILFPDIF